MDFKSPVDHLESIYYAPKLSYFALACVIIYLGHYFEDYLTRGRREKIATKHREIYFQRLVAESLKMEEEKLQEELKLAKSIEDLQQECDEIKSQLDGGDWSDEHEFQPADLSSTEDEANDNEDEEDEEDEEEDEEDGERDNDHDHLSRDDEQTRLESERARQELHELESKAMELKSVEKDIDRLSKSLAGSDLDLPTNSRDEDLEEALQELSERIKQLESENSDLNSQIESHKSILVGKTLTDLDPEIVNFLDQHRDDFTLSFLNQTLEVLIEIKAQDPDKNFTEHLKDLRNSQSNYVADLAELKIAKKEAEIKLQNMKRRYEEELSSFNELRVEHIFKNSGAKEYLTGLKEKNRLNDEIIGNLKAELEAKRNEVALWQSKFREAEKQCNVYCQAWKDTQVRKEQLEAEKRMHQEWDRRALNQSSNMSSASSLIDNQIPPPPPINVPSVDEILRMNGQSPAASPYGVPMASSIPPPPPVDVPFGEILQEARMQ